LRPGGALVILHLAYGGDPAADIAHAVRWASAYDLAARVLGDVPFKLWDGRDFVLQQPDP
ncbi:MAG: hypothetical protein J0H99_18805, partial [Rhodospirillales bacterium]|nr:hypothetical protein [Rhodospirillales bacterium]